ncbi:hypothetical protein ACGFJT_16325 [Actinomadura geliboluensis]|uniref:hypothetical protein n=1 Tax=Actinomadura geliboluensis TaxID=882440 RepID=UPI003718D1F7
MPDTPTTAACASTGFDACADLWAAWPDAALTQMEDDKAVAVRHVEPQRLVSARHHGYLFAFDTESTTTPVPPRPERRPKRGREHTVPPPLETGRYVTVRST